MQYKIAQILNRAAQYALECDFATRSNGNLADCLRLLRLLTADDIRELLPADTVAALDSACNATEAAVADRIAANPSAFTDIDDYDVPCDIELFPDQVLDDILPTLDNDATAGSYVAALQCISEIVNTNVTPKI